MGFLAGIAIVPPLLMDTEDREEPDGGGGSEDPPPITDDAPLGDAAEDERSAFSIPAALRAWLKLDLPL